VPNLSPAGATTAAAVTTAAGYLSPQYLTPIPSTPTLPFQISNSVSLYSGVLRYVIFTKF